ncbi:MAG: tyrosine-protein phosphatase [Bacteroidia bacterium]|nr:tyrosine-protein phosphatase [Bacteroidia bacterium]
MFDLSPDSLKPILVSQPNFRDIGGIPAMNGGVVKTGILYRSGDLSKLSEEDLRRMEEIGIRMIIDFRSDREIVNYPTPEITTVRKKNRITVVDSARDEAERMLEENDEEGISTILIRDYRRMVIDHQDDFREFFKLLTTTEHIPLVYHCAAGKDRTGLATYLLLLSLGVSKTEARRDYLLSNVYLKPLAEKIILEVTDTGKNGEILRPLMEVREEYLDAALGEINRQSGTIERYLNEVLQVDNTALQQRYLK